MAAVYAHRMCLVNDALLANPTWMPAIVFSAMPPNPVLVFLNRCLIDSLPWIQHLPQFPNRSSSPAIGVRGLLPAIHPLRRKPGRLPFALA